MRGCFAAYYNFESEQRRKNIILWGKFEKRLLLDGFCAILQSLHNSIILNTGVQFCDFVLPFSITGEIVSQQCEVYFRGVFHVVEAHFFYTQKIFQKTFEKNIAIINF